MNLSTNKGETADSSEFVENLNLLRHTDFFSSAPIEVVKLFAFVCHRQTYESGETIFNQGEDDAASYYILTGKAKLLLEKGGQTYDIHEYGAEDFLGAVSLMAPMVKPFSLVADEKVTCLVLTRDAFSKVVSQFPDIPLKFIAAIGKKLIKMEKKMIQAYTSPAGSDLRQILGISLI